MRKLLPIVLLFILLAGKVSAQPGFWRNGDGQPVAETDSMRSKDGFAGSLVITPDEDWQEKWSTPVNVTPSFNTADVVRYGKKLFILTLFANPKLDQAGNADVRCDFELISPAGKVELSKKAMSCYAGKIKGNPHNMYLSAPVIGFSGDPGDAAGTWTAKVVLRDAIRGVELPLRATFELKK